MSGGRYLSPEIVGVVVEDYVPRLAPAPGSSVAKLSEREREVLQLMAEGNTTRQLARRLYISPKTGEAHRLRVMNKLEIDNVAQLTKYAIQEGLTSAEP